MLPFSSCFFMSSVFSCSTVLLHLYPLLYTGRRPLTKKAYDIVWHDGLWYKLWDMGIKGRMWRVMKKIYRSAVLLDGQKSDLFNVEQGVVTTGVSPY